ncbi:WS/DGAT/MGAT family O-acyltransferase [Rhodococcus sp. 2H158]|nr:diacylglycerol O-acyltransferase [Rhodococcus rhodochrous]
MPVTDSMFLIAESRERPMHFGSLELFTPPPDAGPGYVTDLYNRLVADAQVDELFRKRPADPVSSLGYTWWAVDDEIDLEYHVRHSALPAPGRIRELFTLVSRLHSGLLDRHRPLWEAYLIEGLADGRFAVYTKMHHALLDGVSGLRLLQRTYTPDPNVRDFPAPWHLPARPGSGTREQDSLFGAARSLAGDVIGAVPVALRIARTVLGGRRVALPYEAPRSMFNVPIDGTRRFAAQSWSRERITRVRQAAGVSSNDVLVAMCAGALRAYLLEQQDLPDLPLIAMVPVSLRAKDAPDSAAGGNSVGVTLCNLGTHLGDPLTRLSTVSDSMAEGKTLFAGMTPLQATVWSALNVAGLALAPISGAVSLAPPPFNLIISNVPGPRERVYRGGSRLDGIYPVSVVLNGQALNITLTTTADTVDFGVVGCRRTVPGLQRLLGHLEDALAELEVALDIS